MIVDDVVDGGEYVFYEIGVNNCFVGDDVVILMNVLVFNVGSGGY